jgi:CRISPR-associated protein Cmr6
MKDGIFYTEGNDKDGFSFRVKRADGKFIDLDMSKFNNPKEYIKFNEQKCKYFKNKQYVSVKIDEAEIYHSQKEPKLSPVAKLKPSIGQLEGKYTEASEVKPPRVKKETLSNIYGINTKFTKLPLDTSQAISYENIDNFHLKLNKTVHFLKIDKSKVDFRNFKDGTATLHMNKLSNQDETDRKKYKYELQHDFVNLPLSQINKTHLKTIKNYCSELSVQTFEPDWRMVVGLGGHSVYETSMTLHHIYGFPYIPASGIKGVVRSWIITEIFGQNVDSEARAFNESQQMCDIFGCPESFSYEDESKNKHTIDTYYKAHKKETGISEKQGEILFFDAFPTNPPKLKMDVMTPHYGDYYKEKWDKKPSPNTYPTDTQNPVPIPFLTVENTPFQFILGSKSDELDSEKYKIEGKTIAEWLKDALENHGIGAKTAVGYGFMNQTETHK